MKDRKLRFAWNQVWRKRELENAEDSKKDNIDFEFLVG